MSLKGEFEKILRDVFKLDSKWVEWYMNNVYDDENIRTSYFENRLASVLFVSPYNLDFNGKEVRCDYISCVATFPNQRGKGFMKSLMHDTLLSLYNQNVPFACLIPASRPLYFIYDRMGFATVFYAEEKRYTALHKFEKGNFKRISPDYAVYSKLEKNRKGALLHTKEQFDFAVKDVEISNGIVVAVEDEEGNSAVAFAECNDEIKVIDILSSNADAYEAALCLIRDNFGEKPIIVWDVPSNDIISLRARGMIRIVNAETALSALADSNHGINITVKVHDSFIPENNGIYRIFKGKCRKIEQSSDKIDLDVSISVLSKILFSTSKIGELFELPTHRPFISLMLD